MQCKRHNRVSAFKLHRINEAEKIKANLARKGLLLICVLALCLCGCEKKENAAVTIEPEAKLTLSLTPAPTAAQTATPTAKPTPTPIPDQLNGGDGVYTIAWLSDTQHYSKKYPETYFAITSFLSKEKERMSLCCIVHTGDLVHNYNDELQWQVASDAQAMIDSIPNGVCAGNHDEHHDEADYSHFCKYFGAERYEDKPWYGGSYQDNRGHYDLVDIGNTPFIFVYMGFAPDSSCLKWMKAVLKEYPERIGVLCTHSYFQTDLKRTDAGDKFYKKVVKECPNVYMVLCGHRYNQACEIIQLDDDGDGVEERSVYQMMNNYQAADEGGSGYMRFLQIDEAKGELRVYSYSPVTDDYVYYDTPESQHEKYADDPADEEYILPLPWIVK